MNGDVDPYYDTCSDSNHTTTGALGVMTGQNIGDLLNAQHVSWGWFQGGFAPTSTNSGGAVCGATTNNIGGVTDADYSPHHNPFEYYASTANPNHLPPSSLSQIGYTDQANHEYDLSDFGDALNGTGGATLPSVSYLKAPEAQDGHPGYSDPTDEQKFIVNEVNAVEKSKYWDSTAIVITYDDSDGWYDHVAPNIVNGSNDATQDAAICTSAAVTVGSGNDRCGYSQRLPFVVISPYTKANSVSSNEINTASVVNFIEDNWLHGQRIAGSFDATSGSLDAHGGVLNFNGKPNFTPVILNPTTGAVVSGGHPGHK
jgi:phospholipase C